MSLLKRSVKSVIGRMGYQVSRKAPPPPPPPDIEREATLVDPPPRHTLGDHPELLTEVRDEAVRLGLSAAAVRVLSDPAFSIEDRARYFDYLKALPGPATWDAAGGPIARIVTAQYHDYQPRSADPELANQRAATLRREGLVRLGTLLSPQQIAEVQDYFLRRPVFNGHVPVMARHRVLRRYVGYTADRYPLGCYPVGDITLAPHLLEMALRPEILDAAAAYLGCTPTLTWLQCWWNFVGEGQYAHLQNNHHRDSNDVRMFWVYMYLTDVNEGEGSGPHSVIRRSGDPQVLRERLASALQDPALAGRLNGLTVEELYGGCHHLPDDVKEALFPGLTEEVYGPAGTVFLTRGCDFHKVVTPIRKRRCLFAARFCINEFRNPRHDRDGDLIPGEEVARRVGYSAKLRHVTRLCFDWDGRRSP
jgi:hypothetical protein